MKKILTFLCSLALFGSVAFAQYSGQGAPVLTCSATVNNNSHWLDSSTGVQYQCTNYFNAGFEWISQAPLLGTVENGQLVVTNPGTPRNTETQLLVANMTAADTAGVAIGSTGTGNTTFTFPVASGFYYDLRCTLPTTFVSSATVRFELTQIATATVSLVNAEDQGNIAASAAFANYNTVAGTSLAGSETPVSGAPGGVSETITYDAQFLASASGNVGIEYVANASNNIQILAGSACHLTQIN